MSSHVRTTIRYDGPALADHEMDVQDLAPALLALGDIVQIANRKFNGNAASISVRVNADVVQKCFQIDLSLAQSVLDHAKGFFVDDKVKTAEEIAKAIGLITGGGVGLFRLIKWLTERPHETGTRFEVKQEGGVTVIVNGDGNSITVSNDVYHLATDTTVIDKAKKVVQPLAKPDYESLEFVEGEHVVEAVAQAQAVAILEAPSKLIGAAALDVSKIVASVRIKTAQYEGHAKWSVLWSGRAIDVTMPEDWVASFQRGDLAAPPHTILRVEMEQTVGLDESGSAVGAPTFRVLAVLEVTLPKTQGDLF